MTMRHLTRTNWPVLALLCLLLLLMQGCYHRTRTPEEVFRNAILDPIPASVTRLQGHYFPEHEWSAWLRFSISADDLARVVAALDAREVGWSEFDHIRGEFSEAPEALRPPQD